MQKSNDHDPNIDAATKKAALGFPGRFRRLVKRERVYRGLALTLAFLLLLGIFQLAFPLRVLGQGFLFLLTLPLRMIAIVVMVVTIANIFGDVYYALARKPSGPRVIRMLKSKGRKSTSIAISLNGICALLAIHAICGRKQLMKDLAREMASALDQAIADEGSPPIVIITDALNLRRAAIIGLREKILPRIERIGFAIMLTPTIWFLRKITGGRGYTIRKWELDRDAYAEFRSI